MTLTAAIIFSLALGCATFVIWDAVVEAIRRRAITGRAAGWIATAGALIAAGLLILIWTAPRATTPPLVVQLFSRGA